MEVEAFTKNVPMSAQKMREVVRQIQGMKATAARAVLAVVPRKGARLVAKTLSDAMANAEHIRTEWTEAKVKQMITDLEAKHANTRNRKRRSKYARELARYQSFLNSPNTLEAESLWVKEAFAQTALVHRRFTPKARGSAGPVRKRRCHIKIVVSDE